MPRINAAAIEFPLFLELQVPTHDQENKREPVRFAKLSARSLYLTETSRVSKPRKLVEKAGHSTCDLGDLFKIAEALVWQKQSGRLHLLMSCGNVWTIELKADGTWSPNVNLRGAKGLPWEPEDEIVCRLSSGAG